ncbi:MAG: hypothetical protein QOF67_510 [Mycobacterium sp.]|nr:hypothetical protein [Mycobacterium sp.]
MGAATHIGRVGGLAVALGVGTAIATGCGVASADDTISNPPGSTNTTTTTGTTTTDTKTSTEPSTTPVTPEQDKGTTSSGTTTNTVTGDVVVSAQTNTGTSGTTAPTATAAPTETADPEPTQTTDPEEPTKTPDAQKVSTPPSASKSSNESGASPSVAKPSAKASAPTVDPVVDPATNIQQPDKVAVFADARALAAPGPTNISPMMAAQVTDTPVTQPPAPASLPDPLTAVANVVSSVINWVLNPLAGTSPTTPAQPPLIWGLLAFARREFENFFNALSGPTAENVVAPPETTSLALDNTEMASFALAAAAVTVNPPYLPFPSAQVSPSTQFVSWVTGGYIYGDPTLANTLSRYSIYGTDLGIMWDNGIPDNPATPNINEHQVLIAVGDTFGGPNSADWRANTILRSSDTDLSNGITIPNGQWYTGNWFGGAPLGPDGYPTRARQVIFPSGLPAGVTLIPTAGISIPTQGTQFGVTQYMSFMSVTQWGAPGQWTTNYSALAYSTDNGENWTVAPQTVRYNQPWTGNQNFQQSAFVRPGDGYVYAYGTPNGRQGAAYLSRVVEKDILDLSKYDYYSAGSPGGWGATPTGWYRNDPSKATSVFGQDTGACGVANPGNQVSEMSVQYNKSLKKYVVLYGDQFNNIVMRTSDTPQGTWSSAKVLMGQQNGGIYAPMMHPWSPSTMGTGTDLYWNLSQWSGYNVMLMRTDLSKV